jgi:hypothetical protein
MLIATEKASVTNCDFKGEYSALNIFEVAATLNVAACSGGEGSPVPYDVHGVTQLQRRRVV